MKKLIITSLIALILLGGCRQMWNTEEPASVAKNKENVIETVEQPKARSIKASESIQVPKLSELLAGEFESSNIDD